MADDVVKRLLMEQRKRLVAGLLGAAEKATWWKRLTSAEQTAYRDKVLTSVGVYHDLVLDVVKVGAEDGIRNEHALQLIEAIHSGQRRLEAALSQRVGV